MVTEAGKTVDERQLVVFDLAAQHYGVDIETVREIIRTPEIRRVPDSPPSVEGVINLRGRVIPVVDLRRRLGLEVTDATSRSRVVVVEIGGDDIGVIVDGVAEVLRIPADAIEGASSLVTTSDSFYIDGIAKIDDQLLILLNLNKALSHEALEQLRERTAKLALVEGEPEAGENGGGADIEAHTPASDEQADEEAAPPELDIELLETSFAAVAPRGDELVAYFYDQLFERYPDVQPLFADADMREQRGKLLSALATVVASLRDPEALTAHLQELGRRHEGYGAEPEHYEAVGEVLLDSLAHIAGDAWTDEFRQAWTDAYAVVADIMIDAALALSSEAGEDAA